MEMTYEEGIRIIHGLKLYLQLVNKILKDNQSKTEMHGYFIQEQLATTLQIKKLTQANQANFQINKNNEQRGISEDRQDRSDPV